MKLLALIPARGGSKGIPQKNIRFLGNKPLIWYSYRSARESGIFNDIILSTDNETIARIGERLGITVPFIRPEELATDMARSVDVVKHALAKMEHLGRNYDAVVLLQPTSPFRRKGLIQDAVDAFARAATDALVSVRKVPHQFNPHWIFFSTDSKFLHISTGDKEIISRRQDLPEAYYRDGQIYITRTDVLVKNDSLVAGKLGFILNEYEGAKINIDTLDDWALAENFVSDYENDLLKQ